ncbi:MAG: RdgB/HAM1 family non-canonical purine NTP pyrophosphatase [Clostridia bacterium]|nr:RdgB/HAM1 family non-canonical purine NTP pyrophosphatase [Clostridia bacterium]
MSEVFVAATHNKGKLKEMEAIVKKLGIDMITRDEAGVPHDYDIVEDGETLEENSYKKAYAIMKMTNLPSIADDTGLMVDYLNGAPGVYTGRFGGPEESADKNNAKLLDVMKDCPKDKRTAKFVTVITLVYPDGKKIVARGECHGRIAEKKCGTNGFGYDPLFIPEGSDLTFAELGTDYKNTISHRRRALEDLERILEGK